MQRLKKKKNYPKRTFISHRVNQLKSHKPGPLFIIESTCPKSSCNQYCLTTNH